jgi:hypothetical protein
MAMAAMAAVSARRMRGPRVTGVQAWVVNAAISSGVQPPSGPMASATGLLIPRVDDEAVEPGAPSGDASAEARVRDCSVSLRRMRRGAVSRVRARASWVGSAISGMSVRRDCLEDSRAMRRQRATLSGGEGEVLFGAAGEDGRDAGDAELGGFFDGPLEAIELEDGEEEMDGECRVGFQLFVEDEGDFGVGYGGDFGAVKEAIGDDVVDLAGLGAEDAAKVVGLLAGEGGVGGVAGLGGPGVGDPAAAHKDSY